MPLSVQLQQYAKRFAKKLIDEQVAIFAGAGLSAGTGFVDWAGLLAPYAEELGLDITREREHLVRLAQYSMNHKGNNRHHLNQNIIEAFPVMHAPGDNHQILARLPINTYWTTNYDKLIETALRSAKKRVDVKYMDSQLPNSTPRRDAVVYKMHGDVEHSNEAVLTRDDYESYSRNSPGFLNALAGDLTGKTFLFVGFSFSDPNLEHVLSEVRQRYHGAQREHFCLLRRPKATDFDDTDDFLYAKVRQRHFINDLRRYNITALELDEYSDVTETLLAIEQYYRRRSVFVGGSAEDYGLWGQQEVDDFCRALGALFVDLQLRIVSGFGLGIGNALISGAIDKAYATNNLHLDSFLDVRPFPRAITDSTRRDQVWHAYRQDLLRIPGIAFFIFGNKKDSAGNIVLADGVRKEFQIAHEQGAIPLPIGGTGSMAKDLADEVLANFTKYCPDGDPVIGNFIAKWNNPITDLADCLQDVRDLVEHIKKK
jgi:hypothetical protein